MAVLVLVAVGVPQDATHDADRASVHAQSTLAMADIASVPEIEEPIWERLYGPPGGYVSTVAIDAFDHRKIYAIGSEEGLYYSGDGGESWETRPYPAGAAGSISTSLFSHPGQPGVVYAGVDGLLRSSDYGQTWEMRVGDTDRVAHFMIVAMDPANPEALYAAGRYRDKETVCVFMSENGGLSWRDITGDLQTPYHSSPAALLPLGYGEVLISIFDEELEEWGNGRVFRTADNGDTWNEVHYGQREPRGVSSIAVHPEKSGELWLSEAPIRNETMDQPLIHKSYDGGETWTPVYFDFGGFDSTQVWIINVTLEGKVYVGAGNLYVTEDGGSTFRDITPPNEKFPSYGTGFYSIAVHPEDPDILYYPMRFLGVCYSEDGGRTWEPRNNGICTTSMLLLEADPTRPATLYAMSKNIDGVFRSDDYGNTWTVSAVAAVGDELDADPTQQGTIWTIADKPNIAVSRDYGETWSLISQATSPGIFNQNSVYAIAQSDASSPIYALSNGYGIFRGEAVTAGQVKWTLSRTSEVDYSYALEADPSEPGVVFSGYTHKPFQDFAMIRATYDDGETWFTSLYLEGWDAITSIAIDSGDTDQLFAASTSAEGGAIWRSEDRGQSWTRANELFSFATIHSSAVGSDGRVYAGVWGGGTWWTGNSGRTWNVLNDEATMSAAAIVVSPANPSTLYIADRTAPILHRSTDGGRTFEPVFDAGAEYSRLMSVAIAADDETSYILAMRAPSTSGVPFGAHGALFRLEAGSATNITGSLPRMPLSLTVNPHDPDTLYAVLHGMGVHRSRDRGNTWSDISGVARGLPDSGFLSLIADPQQPDVLYLIGGCDVQFATYESGGLDPGVVNGVYRSTDGGDSWVCLNSGPLGAESGAVKALAYHEADSNILYAAAENGLFVSTDAGETWHSDKLIPYKVLGGFAISEGIAYAFTNGAGVFCGTVGASGTISWGPDPHCVVPVSFAQVLKDPRDRTTVYASGYPGGVFKTTDGGETWHEANFGLPSFLVEDPLRQGYYALDIAATDPDRLFLGMYGKGVYVSTNGAATWRPMNGADGILHGLTVTSLAIDPLDPYHVFVASEDGVYRTEDGGANWSSENAGLLTSDVKVLDFSPSGVLYAGSRGYGLYKWRGDRWASQNPVANWGGSWPIWNDRVLYQYSDFLFHPEKPGLMLLGSFPVGIFRSTDGGGSWRESNLGWTLDGVFSLICHPEDPDIVYAGTYNGMNRSLDFGIHWETWNVGIPPEQWVFAIDFDPVDPDIMYACSMNGANEGTGEPGFMGTVVKSVDGGATWFEITNGLDLDQQFYHLIVDPLERDTVYLAAERSVILISRDAGASWDLWSEGLEGQRPGVNGNNVTRILEISSDYRYLYYGSYRSGLFRREIHPPINEDDAG